MSSPYFAGVDVGSLSTEAMILDTTDEPVSYAIIETGANSIDAASESFERALAKSGISRDRVKSIVATGYGRISIPFADKRVTEISCHALGRIPPVSRYRNSYRHRRTGFQGDPYWRWRKGP